MKLYNSLSRKIEDFKPIAKGNVKLYTCGPTVYDRVHIGNLRTYIFEDILRRVLRSDGYSVQHVMNITDVDDKTIKRSREEYPETDPLSALTQLTSHYQNIFYDDAKKIGIDLSSSKIVKATAHISDMQKLILSIPNKYLGEDGIYYDITKDKDYGVLVKLDRSHEHHRVNNDEYDKDHVADFALWKSSSEGEPSWEFEVDGKNIEGRPGWHIECSAMSVKYLGQPFDIHTGGVDLIFPHHENEIAQSRAASGGKPLANYFVHGEHLLIDGHKMAKSLKNFVVLGDIVSKSYEPLALRLLFLQAHYRHQLNFTWEALDAASVFLKRLQAWADLQFQPGLGHKKTASSTYSHALDEIKQALNSDLNTGKALAIVSGLVSLSEQEGVDIDRLKTFLQQIDELLGLNLADRQDIDKQAKGLMASRERARQDKDWAKADGLRAQLTKQGIELNDTPHGAIWSRT